MSGNTHTTSKQNSHKPYKNYTQVAFQQGKPVLDYELNDAQAVVLQQLTNHLQTLDQFCGIETSPSEFAIIPLSHANNGVTPRNEHNFGITLGRLPTKLGVIDTMPLRSSTKGNVIAFDYLGLGGNELASDHVYANYILKGKITASTNTTITDTTKDFSKSYLDLVGSTTAFDLLGINDTLTVGIKTNGADLIITNATNTALNGVSRPILSVNDANTITFANLSGLTIGDEYVIVPRNNFSSIVSSYDAQSDIELTRPAKESNPIVAIFVQSFIDDIASEEDSEIKLAQIGMETTHRKQLRWCVRTFQFFVQESEWTKLTNYTAEYTSDVLGAYTPYDNPIDFAKYNTFVTSSNDSILLENGVLKNELSTQITPLSLAFGASQYDSVQKAFNSVYQAKGISAQSLMLKNKASVLSVKMIKALILQTLLGNTELSTNDAITEELLDISVLQLHSSSTKSVGTQTMSPYFYAGMNVNQPLGANSVIPMFTAWKSSYPTDENATIIDGYFYLPPRIFQSQSQISTELLQAKSMTYSFGYKEQFDDFGALILDETNPSYNLLPFTFKSIVSLTKSISSLDETYPTTNVAFDTLAEKLAFNDVSALFILGIGSAYKISLGNSNGRVANIPTLSPTGFENAIHLGFAGQLQSSNSLGSNVFFSDIEYNRQYFGGIVFANPISQTGQGKVSLNQIVNNNLSVVNSNVGYYVPTEVSVNGNPSYFISATSDKGFSFYTDENKLQVREFHQGIAQASVFANTFNLRKLAIKTQASVEADLFTIDVPHVLEQFKDQSIQSSIPAQLLGDAEQTGIDNPSLIPQILSSFAGYKETDLLAQNGIRTNQSPIRTFLGNTLNTGNLSHSSQSSIFRGSYQTLSLFKDGLNTKLFTKEALTYDLSSNTIDDDRIAHDGSTPLENLYSQLDRTFITEEDAYQLPDTLLDYEWGAWAVKKIGVDKFDTNTTLQELPSLSTYTNRNSSATLRYHVGDFYPGQNDERGIPRNLLVDTMNLFVKLEPLPLVHWYTMPKHQHSVLQGSLDVAEAVATLLDISHGRGIPDHLFNKALPFTTKSRVSNVLGNDAGAETT
ncbi:hypothetical protein EB001_16815, partial [bacterium]|nr:hypothetical protein [bacterium]